MRRRIRPGPAARLIEGYSAKLQRRVRLFDHSSFAQWIRLEADPAVRPGQRRACLGRDHRHVPEKLTVATTRAVVRACDLRDDKSTAVRRHCEAPMLDNTGSCCFTAWAMER